MATASRPLVRLIGQRDVDASLAEWQPWVEKLAAWPEAGLEPHVFTHTPDNLFAPDLARRLWAAVHDILPAMAPLPVPRTPGRQLGKFDSH